MFWILGGLVLFIFVTVLFAMSSTEIKFNEEGCTCHEGNSVNCTECSDKIKWES